MALIQCPECNKEISDKVKACPHCGYPFENDYAAASKSSGSLQLVAAVCPRCGADLEFNACLNHFSCTFCGSEVIFENNNTKNKNDSPAESEQFYKVALEAFQAENIHEAIAGLTKTLDADPDHFKAIMLKGVCLAYSVSADQISAGDVISYFKLSQEKFIRTNPSEEEKLEMFESYASNLLTICIKTYNCAQAYISGRVCNQAEYQKYWAVLATSLNFAIYSVKLFEESPMLLNDTIACVFNKTCNSIETICDEICKSRSAAGVGTIWIGNRNEFKIIKENIRKTKNDLIETQRQKYWDEHPEEYRIYKALINERDEQNRIIEANKHKLLGEGAKIRKAAEAKLEEMLHSLKEFDVLNI